MSTISWVCEVCSRPVKDGQGWITISYPAIHRYEEELRTWKEMHGGRLISGAELLEYPKAPRWHVWHRKCDPDIDSSDYTIEIERIRTYQTLLSWTAHLLEKNWFSNTNWSHIIRRVLTREEVAI